MNNTLLNKTVKELREVAKSLGLKGVSRLPKEQLVQAISVAIKNKAQQDTQIVNNIANVHRLADDIANLEAPTTWSRTTGQHDVSLVNRALKKLKATTPMVFGKDARISNEDKLPVVSSKGQKAMMTVGKLLELASQIKEEIKNEDNNRELSEEDIEMLATINNAKKEQQERNEARKNYLKEKRKNDKLLAITEAEEQIQALKVFGDDFFEKFVNLQSIASYMQQRRYKLRTIDNEDNMEYELQKWHIKLKTSIVFTNSSEYKIVNNTPIILAELKKFANLKRLSKQKSKYVTMITKTRYSNKELYDMDVKTLSSMIINSFDTQNLASTENFEKDTEYAKLIENVLIKTGTFDYKEKDSFVNSPEDIADVLLAEQKEISFRSKVAYHNRESAKKDNKLRPATPQQLSMIDNMRFAYYKKHKVFPMLPVQSYAQITSSILASAIIEKYEEYCQDRTTVSYKMAKRLFDRMVKWNVANSSQEVAFIRALRMNYSYEEVYTVLNITYTDMWLVKKYAEANGLKIVEASLKVSKMKKSTRYSATQYYKTLELNQRMSLYNVEDDK